MVVGIRAISVLEGGLRVVGRVETSYLSLLSVSYLWLSRPRMEDFSAIVLDDPSPVVRSIGMDAIASADFPEKTSPSLCEVARSDPDDSLRAWAVRGLAKADSEDAVAIVHASFTSDSETMRAAAVKSAAGQNPPAAIVGPDYSHYLSREFRAAESLEYQKVLMDRLLSVSPDEYRKTLRLARAATEKRGARG